MSSPRKLLAYEEVADCSVRLFVSQVMGGLTPTNPLLNTPLFQTGRNVSAEMHRHGVEYQRVSRHAMIDQQRRKLITDVHAATVVPYVYTHCEIRYNTRIFPQPFIRLIRTRERPCM